MNAIKMFVDEARAKERRVIMEYLQQFKETSFRAKDQRQAFNFLFERKYSAAAEWLRKGIRIPELSVLKVCLVTVRNQDGSIYDLGGSIPYNLGLDNYGTFQAAMFAVPPAPEITYSLTDIVPTAFNFKTYAVAGAGIKYFGVRGSPGTTIQVGSGSTAPTRADTNIETAFGDAPENARFATTTGSYAAGTVSFSGSITSGGAGTIKEVVMFAEWMESVGGIEKVIALWRDAPTEVAFVAGKVVAAAYEIPV